MIGPIRKFNSFGARERAAVEDFATDARVAGMPLSGYLAGKERGGGMVCALETSWAETFKVKHAIACNSATSGLMAAAFAIELKPGDQFICPSMTMTATAAAPMFTGATPYFVDVDDDDFNLCPFARKTADIWPKPVRAIIVTNLFGHPARLMRLRTYADQWGCPMIEDNAQSPFAWEGDKYASTKYAGTIGHIGVFSLNVHKPLQCGEGGMIVTDDDRLAARLRRFINHGENASGSIGLNLRMPEICAAIALVQLRRGDEIIQGRIDQAQALIAACSGARGIRAPVTRPGCRHVYYTVPFLIEQRRPQFIQHLRAAGVPIEEGYIDPLYRLPAFARFARSCPVAEDLQDRRLLYFENCAYDLTLAQIEEIGEAFHQAAEKVL
jgi:perosamine synthetase